MSIPVITGTAIPRVELKHLQPAAQAIPIASDNALTMHTTSVSWGYNGDVMWI